MLDIDPTRCSFQNYKISTPEFLEIIRKHGPHHFHSISCYVSSLAFTSLVFSFGKKQTKKPNTQPKLK